VDEIAQRYVALALTVLECRPAARTRALRAS